MLVPPERDYRGDALDAGTGLRGAHMRGVHLRLPGYGEDGPTLEIYSYDVLEPRPAAAVNRPGYAHIAFAVDDVPSARQLILESGGGPIGQVVTLTTSVGTRVTWCYVTDPEGNIIELQSWEK
jgi:catechol 2,3-dioxygenase-like lactoylglutathione lyase family enzyme